MHLLGLTKLREIFIPGVSNIFNKQIRHVTRICNENDTLTISWNQTVLKEIK
jgi:hypothetical protein